VSELPDNFTDNFFFVGSLGHPAGAESHRVGGGAGWANLFVAAFHPKPASPQFARDGRCVFFVLFFAFWRGDVTN
jgi:hypothetical protein